jgi:hypothetical protein
MGRDPGGLPAAADDDDFLEERLMVARPLAFFFPSGFGGAPLSRGCFSPARGRWSRRVIADASALVWFGSWTSLVSRGEEPRGRAPFSL